VKYCDERVCLYVGARVSLKRHARDEWSGHGQRGSAAQPPAADEKRKTRRRRPDRHPVRLIHRGCVMHPWLSATRRRLRGTAWLSVLASTSLGRVACSVNGSLDTSLFLFFSVLLVDYAPLTSTRQRLHIDPQSLCNTNRKSYIYCQSSGATDVLVR